MMKKIFILLLLLFISLTSFSQRAAEFKNGITIQKEEVLASKFVSYGESYINNWRDLVLDKGATYFPNNGGYEIGRLHQAEINTSLHFIPAAVGEGVIYAIGKNRVNDLDVSNSASTYVDEDGIIQTAAIDFARIDYTDGDGAILAEPQSINLLTRSEDFSHADWTKVEINVSQSNDGIINGVNAFVLTDTANNTSHWISQTWVGVTGDNSNFGIFKKGTQKYICLTLYRSSTNWINAIFNLETGVLTDTSIGGIATINKVGIIDFNNGWFYCYISGTPFEDTQKTTYITIANEATTTIALPSYLGTGNGTILIAAAQGETSPNPSSYIKTEGTTVTRLADVITGAGDVNTFNSKEGVLFVEMAALADDSTNRMITLSNGTNDNTIILYYSNSSNRIRYIYEIGGVQSCAIDYDGATITDFNEIAIKWKLNDFALYVNGVEVGTDISGAVHVADFINDLSLKRSDGLNFYGKIKQLKVYKSISEAQKDFPYITNFFPLLLIGFRRRNQYKNAA